MNKKVFLDTNIVADIIDCERVNHTLAIRLLEKAILEEYDICISEDMITTLYYISKDKTATLDFLKNVVFVDWEVLSFGKNTLFAGVDLALQNRGFDLEDTLQCLCAKNSGCMAIITKDKKFVNCGIDVMNYEEFLDYRVRD